MDPKLKATLTSVYEFSYLYYLAVRSFVLVFWRQLQQNPAKLFPLHELAEQSFAELWLEITERRPVNDDDPNVALLGSATGVVLDVGPGSGMQTRWLTNSALEKVYLAEPVTLLHPALRQSAIDAGLADKHQILTCRGEPASLDAALVAAGILDPAQKEPIFDTIICSKVLCTIPQVEAAAANLYALLKPGGRILVSEHVKNKWRQPKGSLVARIWQIAIMKLGWSFFLAGCEVDRDTVAMLTSLAVADGGWADIDVEYPDPHCVLPSAIGSFTKRS